ncbi:TPA: hypothetical protein ACH3X1_007205 [Trebouxia sp. C0004]
MLSERWRWSDDLQVGCTLRRSSTAGVPWSLLEGPFSPAAAQHASQSLLLGACLEGTRSRASKIMCILPVSLTRLGVFTTTQPSSTSSPSSAGACWMSS